MEEGNIPLCMRIMKETGCLLEMSHGSKHLTSVDLNILKSFYAYNICHLVNYFLLSEEELCHLVNY